MASFFKSIFQKVFEPDAATPEYSQIVTQQSPDLDPEQIKGANPELSKNIDYTTEEVRIAREKYNRELEWRLEEHEKQQQKQQQKQQPMPDIDYPDDEYEDDSDDDEYDDEEDNIGDDGYNGYDTEYFINYHHAQVKQEYEQSLCAEEECPGEVPIRNSRGGYCAVLCPRVNTATQAETSLLVTQENCNYCAARSTYVLYLDRNLRDFLGNQYATGNHLITGDILLTNARTPSDDFYWMLDKRNHNKFIPHYKITITYPKRYLQNFKWIDICGPDAINAIEPELSVMAYSCPPETYIVIDDKLDQCHEELLCLIGWFIGGRDERLVMGYNRQLVLNFAHLLPHFQSREILLRICGSEESADQHAYLLPRVMSGAEFNKFTKGRKFVRMLNSTGLHNGFQWREGLNEITTSTDDPMQGFREYSSCSYGLYIVEELELFRWVDCGEFVNVQFAYVTVLDDSIITQDSTDGFIKFKTNKVLLHNIRPLTAADIIRSIMLREYCGWSINFKSSVGRLCYLDENNTVNALNNFNHRKENPVKDCKIKNHALYQEPNISQCECEYHCREILEQVSNRFRDEAIKYFERLNGLVLS